jgi:hypothetical protein
MKKGCIILAMLLVAATAFPQTSRMPANSNETAGNRSNETVSTARPDNTPGSSHSATQRQVPVTSNNRQGNDRESVAQPRTGNTPGRIQDRNHTGI